MMTARSMADTFGKSRTTACWMCADWVASAARNATTWNFGAASSTPAGNTMKKFGCMRRQSTSRRLPTFVFTGTPCTSNTISSPRPTWRSRARDCSTEIGATAVPGVTLPVNLPDASCSVSLSFSRNVERYSRRSVQPATRDPLSFKISATARPLTERMRIVTIGAPCCTGAPLARRSFSSGATWSSWMSNSIRFGRWLPPTTRSWLSNVSRDR